MVERPAERISGKIIITGIICAVLAHSGCRTAPAGPYRMFVPEGKEFTCEIPADWKTSGYKRSSGLSIRSPDAVQTVSAYIDISQVRRDDWRIEESSGKTIAEVRSAIRSASSSTFTWTAGALTERLELLKKLRAEGFTGEYSVEPLEPIQFAGFNGFKYSITSINVIARIMARDMLKQEWIETEKKINRPLPKPVLEKETYVYFDTPDGQYQIKYRAPIAVYELNKTSSTDVTRKTPAAMYEKHRPEFEHLLNTLRWIKKAEAAK